MSKCVTYVIIIIMVTLNTLHQLSRGMPISTLQLKSSIHPLGNRTKMVGLTSVHEGSD